MRCYGEERTERIMRKRIEKQRKKENKNQMKHTSRVVVAVGIVLSGQKTFGGRSGRCRMDLSLSHLCKTLSVFDV